MTETRQEIDSTRPHPARMYDYYLGGKDWFGVDREAAEEVLRAVPFARTGARQNRAFMQRAVRALAAEHGIRQFLDLGSGIPTEPNLHQVVQQVAPECRVVYADNDPMVLEYVDVLMHGTAEGRTAYVESDVRTDDLLYDERVRAVLDLTQPVALSLVALLHFFPDELDPHDLVGTMVERLPAGSCLVLSHATNDLAPEEGRRIEELYRRGGNHIQGRTREEFARFFDGLELLDPGVQLVHRWRPEERPELNDAEVSFYGAVARKP
ncbi:SAM-dependent methyltransferase [Streptomyces sulphureus]|uniref:SAM-dependent methyltransferase n=1 Tax=Streptomyces sulphureus TaxID=47758 RepID=UPI00038046C0|nr:SAM-dependent methyltransferase [Streptomyces sulphureus]